MAEAESNGFEFLSDPVDRFPPMDLSHDNSLDYDEGAEVLIRARSDSSMGDAGDAALTVDADLNSTREAVALTVAPSETSTGWDDPQAPGWTRRPLPPEIMRGLLVCVLASEHLTTVVPSTGFNPNTICD
ncbi:uncharacterized protein LOC119340823 isoform X2 [Triticum dicoccoides]|uniref:uncharacterized protein LOC119340823 isoform X2 n=1 Tax=Triticum dicoccoides TaxID=85692 RepID=UPI001891E3EF|nr:uncharacterized protein LOC119340823 isoform X2 [Triticum dicoccoides]